MKKEKLKSDSKAYSRYLITSSREDFGIYKFPGEFFIFGVIALGVDWLVEHPLVDPEFTVIGIFFFILEAVFLFRKYIRPNLK
jgi:hypothetical protein